MCGIAGVRSSPVKRGEKKRKGASHPTVAEIIIMMLFALQHRGHDSSGISLVSTETGQPRTFRAKGLVKKLAKKLEELKGAEARILEAESGVGHNRYQSIVRNQSPSKISSKETQPLESEVSGDVAVVAHNGELLGARFGDQLLSVAEARQRLTVSGSIFHSSSDSELFLHLLAHARGKTTVERVMNVLNQAVGAFSVLIIWRGYMFAARDPRGFRPLAMAYVEQTGQTLFASETCAFSLVNGVFQRTIKPGEVVIINPAGKQYSRWLTEKAKRAECIFEEMYFSRPDSMTFDRSVSRSRRAFGRLLAEQLITQGKLPEFDIVVPMLDSGLDAALGFAEVTGIPIDLAVIRNHYFWRSFTTPGQQARERQVMLKHAVDAAAARGLRVGVIDDTLVRSTTATTIIKMLWQAGATKVYWFNASPPTTGGCPYGIATRSNGDQPIAATKTIEEIRSKIGATGLYYVDLVYLQAHNQVVGRHCCDACFSGQYPIAPLTTTSK